MGRVARLLSISLTAAVIPACGGSSNSKPPATLPDPPTGLVATAATTARIDLVWVDASNNEFEFRIERADALAGPYVQIAAVPMDTQAYTDLGLQANKQYFYRITAFNSVGNSANAGPSSATTNALTWTAAPMTGGPPAGITNHSAVYDSLGRRMVVFGGIDDGLTVQDQHWFFDLNTLAIPATPWSAPAVTGTAPFRFGHSAIYDTANNRMIIFGGQDEGFVYRNDVFILNLTTMAWSLASVTGTVPTARALHTAIYDSANQQMILYGGTDGISQFPDLHVLSLPPTVPFAWSSPSVSISPIERSRHASIYDPLRLRMVTFAGFDQSAALDGSGMSNETWTLSTSGTFSWNQLLFSGTPTFRMGHSGVYDAANQRMIMFAGATDTAPALTTELWGLKLDVSPTWSILNPTSPPFPRMDHSAVYDTAFNRMIIYGGVDDLATSFNEVWIIRL